MSVRWRWLVAGLIVVAAAVIALWPRGHDAPGRSDAQSEPDLVAARHRAALAPCETGARPGPPALAGARAQCLADGSTVDLERVVARPALINIWATWCQPCKEELPILAEYAAAPGAVPVLGLAMQSPPADALELLATLKVRFANLVDPDESARRALKIPDTLPASYVIGSDGTVHLVTDPRLFRSADQVRQTVARYLPPDGSGTS